MAEQEAAPSASAGIGVPSVLARLLDYDSDDAPSEAAAAAPSAPLGGNGANGMVANPARAPAGWSRAFWTRVYLADDLPCLLLSPWQLLGPPCRHEHAS